MQIVSRIDLNKIPRTFSLDNLRYFPFAASSDSSSSLTTRLASLEKLTKELISLLKKSTASDSRDEVRQPTSRETAFRSARGVPELLAASEGVLAAAASGRSLFCTACTKDPTSAPGDPPNTAGVFACSYDINKTFSYSEHLPTSFRCLKDTIKRHFSSDRHLRAEEAAKRRQNHQLLRDEESGGITMRVLRTAYYVISKSLPHTMFEELIVLQHKNGMNMGDLNHSKMFMAKARQVFSEEVRDKLKEHIDGQPCVALMADKVTVNGKTMDITAVTTVVPGAPVGKMLQSFVVGAPVVANCSGSEHAKQLQATIGELGITHTEQLAAIAADGQVHHNSVPKKLLAEMSSADSLPASSACVPCVWDQSHLVNLADADARNSDKCKWVGETIEVVTRVTKRFKFGTANVALFEAGRQIGKKVLHPKLWSETRFAPHASAVFHTFLNNVPSMIHALQERTDSEGRVKALRELKEDLQILRGGYLQLNLTFLSSA